MRITALLAFSTLISTSTLVAQAVHVVDPNGGGTHTHLRDAVLDASSGDVIEVLGGFHHMALTPIDKSLTIVGDGTAQINSAIVRGLPASGTVLVSGVSSRGGFTVMNCAGRVKLQDMPAESTSVHRPAPLSIVSSNSVDLENVSNFALVAVGSGVRASSSEFVGFFGFEPDCNPYLQQCPLPTVFATAACMVSSTWLQLYNCSATGGTDLSSVAGGGAGVVLQGSTLHAVGCQIHSGFGLGGMPPDIVGPAQSIHVDPSDLPSLDCPSLLREHEPFEYSLGASGESAQASTLRALAFSLTLGSVEFPFLRGSLATATPFDVVPVASFSGKLSLPSTPSGLVPGLLAETFHVQLLELDLSALLVRVSGARSITLFDAGH